MKTTSNSRYHLFKNFSVKSFNISARKVTAVFTALAMLFSCVPELIIGISSSPVFAADPPVVTSIERSIIKNGTVPVKYVVSISGSNLKSVDVSLDKGDASMHLATPTTRTDTNIEINILDTKQPNQPASNNASFFGAFTGKIRVGSVDYKTGSTDFPTISRIEDPFINTQPMEPLIIIGSFLNKISELGYYAEYGAGGNTTRLNYSGSDPSRLEIANPGFSGTPGFQQIFISQNFKINDNSVDVSVNHIYKNAFSFMENLNFGNLSISPTQGSAGDIVTLSADAIPGSYNDYFVYFRKTDDQLSSYSDSLMATSLELKNGKQLIIKLPSTIPIGQYRVYLTKKSAQGIYAEQIVGSAESPTVFTVIDNVKKPLINNVSPATLTDSGGDTTITGYFLLYPSVYDLTGSVGTPSVEISSDKHTLTADFSSSQGLMYQGKSVSSLKRKLNVLVGSSCKFRSSSYGEGESGLDSLGINIGAIAIEEGKNFVVKEMVVTIVTEITTSDGKTYTVVEEARKPDAVTFTNSSFLPVINSVLPPKIQVSGKPSDLIDERVSLKNDVVLAITGKNFFVDKYVSGNTTHKKMPNVLFQAGTNLGDFELGFFPNAADADINDDLIGEVRIDSKQTGTDGKPGKILTDSLGNPVQFQMIVLNDKNMTVTGDSNNNLGTQIILKMPKSATVPDGWTISEKTENIEVQNPKKLSSTMGLSAQMQNAVSFVKLESTHDITINSVVPDTVSVDGGQEIIVKGSNFKDGLTVYIDGVAAESKLEISGITAGEQQIRVKTPKLRSGKLQLLVMNSTGANAVWDLTAIKPFSVSPKINSFNPVKGVPDTLVSLRGENFFRPMRSQSTSTENDIFRYIGTRVYLDGKDINTYNRDVNKRIILLPYESPDANPVLNTAGAIADYADALVLKTDIDRLNAYSLTRETNGDILLYNGSEESYKIVSESTGLKAYPLNESGLSMDVDVTKSGISLSRSGHTIALKFFTPYKFDASTGEISGKRMKVISTGQILFNVPNLGKIGSGYVDLAVINPDIKRDEKTGNQGFYYIPQAIDHPVITSLLPDTGSVNGGYYIDVVGINFKQNIRVYVDGVAVPTGDIIRSNDEKSIKVKIPKCTKDLKNDYKTDRLGVPFTLVNENGGSATKTFTYVTPITQPMIQLVDKREGTTNGNELVTVTGTGFAFTEPFIDVNNNGKRDDTEPFTDLNNDGKYTDTLKDQDSVAKLPLAQSVLTYDSYFDSTVLPQIYFGNKKAKIVEYSEGRIVVLSPSNKKGVSPIYLVNNDFGRSNEVAYTYTASSPKIAKIEPDKGGRAGQEIKTIQGSGFSRSEIFGYNSTAAAPSGSDFDAPVPLTDVHMPVRFGDLDNLKPNPKVDKGTDNTGAVYNGAARVEVEGGLVVNYSNSNPADGGKISLMLLEAGKNYSGAFKDFNSKSFNGVYIPVGMLKASTGAYYTPSDYTKPQSDLFEPYEYIKVYINDANQLKVERGYSPKVEFDNSVQIKVMTPSFYTIGKVKTYVYNSDGGVATGDFTYTNPASRPGILKVVPSVISPDGTYKMTQTSIKSPLDFEIIGRDFRDMIKVTINGKKVEVKSITKRVVSKAEGGDGGEYEVILARSPLGTDADIDEKYPIILENEDGGMASSVTPLKMSDGSQLPVYFVYKKPLSDPTILEVTPKEMSVYGGTKVTVKGKDLRKGLKLLISDSGSSPQPSKPSPGAGGSSQYEVKTYTLDAKGTEITFIVPTGLKPGYKTIQIVNADFGTGTLDKAFRLISYPKVTGVTDLKKNPVPKLSTTGGNKILVHGTDFDKGARVIFSLPDKRKKKETPGTADNAGMWKDSNYYMIEDGAVSKDIKFIDEKTLEVTVPAFDEEKEVMITVINGDGGISDSDLRLKYAPPVPGAPENLKVRVIAGKNIELYDYEMDGADNLAIYYYIGTKSASALISNDYKDFKYYGTTDKKQYKINDLPGFEERSPSDDVSFVIKPANKFGYSDYSNIARLKAPDISKTPTLGEPDYDGKLGVPSGKTHSLVSAGDAATVILSSSNIRPVTANMTDYSDSGDKRIVIPGNRVRTDSSNVGFTSRDISMSVKPNGFFTSQYISVSSGQYPYVIAKYTSVPESDESLLSSAVPRFKKMIGKPGKVEFSATDGVRTSGIPALKSNASLTFRYNPSLASGGEATIGLYKFNLTTSNWQKVAGKLNRSKNNVVYKTSKPGIFVLMSNK